MRADHGRLLLLARDHGWTIILADFAGPALARDRASSPSSAGATTAAAAATTVTVTPTTSFVDNPQAHIATDSKSLRP